MVLGYGEGTIRCSEADGIGLPLDDESSIGEALHTEVYGRNVAREGDIGVVGEYHSLVGGMADNPDFP